MKIVCLSDTHGLHEHVVVPKGDVLIHAGDCLGHGTKKEYLAFLDWFGSHDHLYKIVVPGNHDAFIQNATATAHRYAVERGVRLLVDEAVTYRDLAFYGFPWTPLFGDWHFMLPRNGEQLRRKVEAIPTDTDVLISHGPPFGTLDRLEGGEHVGCELLAERLPRLSLQLFLCGHLHSAYGVKGGLHAYDPIMANVAVCDERYRPVNPPIVIDL